MEEHIRDIEEGSVIFSFSEQGRHCFILKDKKNYIYLYVTTSRFEIIYKSKTDKPYDLFKDSSLLKWHKPEMDKGKMIFRGRCENGVVTHFEISETDIESELSVTQKESPDSKKIPDSYNMVPSLEDFEVIHGVLSEDKLFFLGVLRSGSESDHVFGEVNVSIDKVERLYWLESDKGNIVPTFLDVDRKNNRVVVTGSIVEEELTRPYVDAFLLTC